MFVEMTKEAYDHFSVKLAERGLFPEVSDCTIEGDSQPHIHLDFGKLSDQDVRDLANDLDGAYEIVSKESLAKAKAEKETDYERDNKREIRKKPWEDRMHTSAEEARGYITGAANEEVIVR